jgi:hypothetical protein
MGREAEAFSETIAAQRPTQRITSSGERYLFYVERGGGNKQENREGLLTIKRVIKGWGVVPESAILRGV